MVRSIQCSGSPRRLRPISVAETASIWRGSASGAPRRGDARSTSLARISTRAVRSFRPRLPPQAAGSSLCLAMRGWAATCSHRSAVPLRGRAAPGAASSGWRDQQFTVCGCSGLEQFPEIALAIAGANNPRVRAGPGQLPGARHPSQPAHTFRHTFLRCVLEARIKVEHAQRPARRRCQQGDIGQHRPHTVDRLPVPGRPLRRRTKHLRGETEHTQRRQEQEALVADHGRKMRRTRIRRPTDEVVRVP